MTSDPHELADPARAETERVALELMNLRMNNGTRRDDLLYDAAAFLKRGGQRASAPSSHETAGEGAGVPAGWKLVPVDPTDKMLKALFPHVGQLPGILRMCWREVLAASPPPPAPKPAPREAGGPTYTANCCNCGRIVDTRETDEGGDGFGAELSDDRWTCSPECWDAVVEPAPREAGQADAGVREAASEAFARLMSYGVTEVDGRNMGRLFRFEGGAYFFLSDTDRAAIYRILDAALATPPPSAGTGEAVVCQTCEGTGYAFNQMDEREEECPDCERRLSVPPLPAAAVDGVRARGLTSDDQPIAWPPLKKALWLVVTGERLNDGRYVNAYELTDKLYAAALTASPAGEE